MRTSRQIRRSAGARRPPVAGKAGDGAAVAQREDGDRREQRALQQQAPPVRRRPELRRRAELSERADDAGHRDDRDGRERHPREAAQDGRTEIAPPRAPGSSRGAARSTTARHASPPTQIAAAPR